MSKTCPSCKVDHADPATAFYRSKTTRDGYHAICKECHRARGRRRLEELRSRPDSAIDRPASKTCVRCGVFYGDAAANFLPNKNHVDGFHPWCRPCARKEKKEWKERNPDRVQVQVDRFGATVKERRRSDERYREHLRALNRAYKQTPEHRQQAREWLERNAERIRHYDKARGALKRARTFGAEGVFHPADVLFLYALHGGRCFWCDRDVSAAFETDHLIPLSKGGTNWLWNIVISCRSCNLKKGERLPLDWAEGHWRNLSLSQAHETAAQSPGELPPML